MANLFNTEATETEAVATETVAPTTVATAPTAEAAPTAPTATENTAPTAAAGEAADTDADGGSKNSRTGREIIMLNEARQQLLLEVAGGEIEPEEALSQTNFILRCLNIIGESKAPVLKQHADELRPLVDANREKFKKDIRMKALMAKLEAEEA